MNCKCSLYFSASFSSWRPLHQPTGELKKLVLFSPVVDAKERIDFEKRHVSKATVDGSASRLTEDCVLLDEARTSDDPNRLVVLDAIERSIFVVFKSIRVTKAVEKGLLTTLLISD